jgi:hypothetical protein
MSTFKFLNGSGSMGAEHISGINDHVVLAELALRVREYTL